MVGKVEEQSLDSELSPHSCGKLNGQNTKFSKVIADVVSESVIERCLVAQNVHRKTKHAYTCNQQNADQKERKK